MSLSAGSRAMADLGPMMGRVVVYSIVGCPHCKETKATLKSKGIPFVDVNLNRFPNSGLREWLKGRTGGVTSVPQIFFNKTHIGGNRELQILVSDQEKWGKAFHEVWTTEAPSEEDGGPKLPHPAEAVEDVKLGDIACEKDDEIAIIDELRASNLVAARPAGDGFIARCLKSKVKNTIVGKDLVDFIAKSKQKDRSRALQIANIILLRNLIKRVNEGARGDGFVDSDASLYAIVDGVEANPSALNADKQSNCSPKDLSVIGEGLRQVILQIYGDHLSDDGKSVDYEGIKNSEGFKSYLDLARQLQNVEITENTTSEERLAFFINVYNALVIHGMVAKGRPKSDYQRYMFFSRVSYIIDSMNFSLNDIENGVLRSNRPSMATLYMTPFSNRNDRRLKVILPVVEPRIHFALNCGSNSCPPIKTFSARNINEELSLATEAFLQDDEAFCVDEDAGIVYLSMIFNWYKVDFGKSPKNVVQWIYDNMSKGGAKAAALKRIIETDTFKIKYIPYDWGGNDTKK